MATFATLKTSVSVVLGLDTTASGIEDVELGKKLNDAVRDFLLRTRCNVNASSMTLTADTYDYDLPETVLAILDLDITGSSQRSKLERTSPAEILRMRQAETTGVARYYALNGATLLMVYPTPTAADTITIYYVPRPTEMSAAGNDPSTDTYGGIPVEYHPALEEFAKWKLADYDDDSSSQMGVVYQGNYERLVRQAIKAIRGRGGRSLGRAVVGRRGLVRTSNSQDLW